MNYSVKTIAVFERQAKRLIKKYPSLKTEIFELIRKLKLDPMQGEAIGHNCYKIRISIRSKSKGKRGGARVITNFLVADETVFLLTIYDKADKQNLTNKELKELLRFLPE